jgi:alkanesulfonate monooxygenase SsuD/methylene tetrahydromethanopterin reductase-like flavin-dependent oxidoreductase (luciferase family)
MDVGVYFDLRNPPGWHQPPERLYAFTLEVIEEAERLGARSVWLSEHHLFEDGYLTRPLTFAAAIAARTSRIRVGTAIVQAPLHQPVALAEDATIVDILSSGRLDLGLGAGYAENEFDLFGAERSRRLAATFDAARTVREIWSDPRHAPHPLQERLPIWFGVNGPQGARRAGLMGERLLSVAPRACAAYLEGLQDGGHPASAAHIKGPLSVFVTEDPERDWPAFRKHWLYQRATYAAAMSGPGGPLPEFDSDAARNGGLVAGSMASLAYGTPEYVAEQIRAATAHAPVEEIFFWSSVAGMPEDLVVEHVRVSCERLAPLLRTGRG